MYNFADTVAGSANSPSMSLQTVFNGINLDNELSDENGGFTTLVVSGRGLLDKRINSFQSPGTHGQKELNYTYATREIQVKFMIEDKTNGGFRDRFNQLSLLLSDSQRELRFTDEEGFFVATLESADLPDEDSNRLVGTLNFICSDPAKYKAEKTLNIGTAFTNHQIAGSAVRKWISRTVFGVETKNFTLENNAGGKITLNYTFGENDVLEIDYEKRLIKLNGVARMPLLSLQSNWFKLKPGTNRLRASHATVITYRETYY
ncbi:distal tail protein Dit [Shouchella rhizosphaerae]|uniref:distal tail protein Dit n=1 Tax=Shouchella rhizosphaerae TaxID=866786 RepID=UPI003F803B62